MRRSLQVFCLTTVAATGSLAAADKPLTYEEHIKPIFRTHCFKCHSEDEKKAGINLATYADLIRGGSGGEVVRAGRPNNSTLYLAVAHEGDDVAPMPPKAPRIADGEIAQVKKWIEQGLIESEGGKSKAPQFRNLEFKSVAAGKLEGPPPMPANLPELKLTEPKRANAITALACSPRAPLLAVAGQERITLYDTDKNTVLGILPFAEGVPHVLRFSRDGALLLAAGGRGVKLGKAVLYDIKTGKRLADFGDETDVVLAADLSPDQKLLALGGPTKTVKVFSTRDGRMLYKISKHTDWVTAIEFSPDGQKLATGDRNGSAFLWEAETGGAIYALSDHKDSVNAISWRGDGEVLATGGEDGQLIVWDAKEGWSVNTTSPHTPKAKNSSAKLPGGVLSVAYSPDGSLYSVGRDGAIRVWKNGNKAGSYESLSALPTRLAVSHDGKKIFAGDLKGAVWAWSGTAAKELQPVLLSAR